MAAAREPIALHFIIDNLRYFASSTKETCPPSSVKVPGCESKGGWRETFGSEDRGAKSSKWGVMHAGISLPRCHFWDLRGGRAWGSRNLCILHMPCSPERERKLHPLPACRQALQSRAACNLPGRATLSHSLLPPGSQSPGPSKGKPRQRGQARRGAATRPPSP